MITAATIVAVACAGIAAVLTTQFARGAAVAAVPDIDRVISPDDAAKFDQFALYSGGNASGSWDLTDIIQTEQEPTQALQEAGITNWDNNITFEYGSCTVPKDSTEGGCADPLQIQIWPACDRSIADYPKPGSFGFDYTRTTLLDVPAALVDEGGGDGRVELYTGAVTLVIFAPSTDDAVAASKALKPINQLARDAGGTVGSDGYMTSLPPPVDGAMDGTLTCSHPMP
jgi:hypothetical protein